MTDERGRKRDTPEGVFGPSGPPGKNAGHAPRGAGLSGNLPAGSRYGGGDPKTPGSVPASMQNQPRRTIHDPRAQDVSRGGPWHNEGEPVSAGAGAGAGAGHRLPQEPPMAAPRSPAPPRPPQASRGVDGFAPTRPAEVVGGRAPSMEPGTRGVSRTPGANPGSSRPNERGAAGAARAVEGKPSLKLKLEGDTYYEANEGRVKVPKRRGPVFFGFLVVLTLLAVGAFLWIDAHGGIENFVAALEHLGDTPDPAVQTSLKYDDQTVDQPAASGALVATPGPQPGAAMPPAAQQPSAAPEQPVAPPASDKPAQAAPQPTGQVATGEIEAPEEQPAAAQPANETGVKPEQQPVAAKPKPKPVVAKPKPKPKPVVRRDPVLRVQPLGDVLNAAPPDPGGGETLPPPDPPAPD